MQTTLNEWVWTRSIHGVQFTQEPKQKMIDRELGVALYFLFIQTADPVHLFP